MSYSEVIRDEICKKSVYKVSKSRFFRKRSFFFTKKESCSEEVFFTKWLSAERSFFWTPSLSFNLWTDRENWKIRSVYKKMNKCLTYSILDEWTWNERKRNTKDISFERTFQAVQNGLFVTFFFVLLIFRKFRFLSTSRYKIRFFHSVSLISRWRYELESWNFVWQWDTPRGVTYKKIGQINQRKQKLLAKYSENPNRTKKLQFTHI